MKFFFAWVEGTETFNANTHARMDEDIFNLEIIEKEGQFPQALVRVTNPRCGLKAPLRPQRAFIACDRGAGAELCFAGSVTAVPESIDGETVLLHFTAEPRDSATRLNTLHATLKESPYWDPLFVEGQTHDDPYESLDARSALFYWSRTTQEVSLSDYTQGSQQMNIGGAYFWDSLKISQEVQPLDMIEVSLRADWKQTYRGRTNLSKLIRSKFPGKLVNSLTGPRLAQNWWRENERIGRGQYWVEESSIEEIKPPRTGVLNVYPALSEPFWIAGHDPFLKTPATAPVRLRLKRYWYRTKLILGWLYQQNRREIIRFKLHHQSQLTGFGGLKTRRLSLTLPHISFTNETPEWQPSWGYSRGFKVCSEGRIYRCLRTHFSGETFDKDQTLWRFDSIQPVTLPSPQPIRFFDTTRGQKAIVHAIEIARAHLAASARCVSIQFAGAIEDLIHLTCDHTIFIADPRLPGGRASGKVKSLRIVVQGKTGKRWVEVGLGVSVGVPRPSIIPPTPECYANSDAIEEGYTQPLDTWHTTPSGIVYQTHTPEKTKRHEMHPEFFGPSDIIESCTVHNHADHQNSALLSAQYPHAQSVGTLLRDHQTDVEIVLRDLKGKEVLTHETQVRFLHPWTAPQQIDLRAPLNAQENDDVH